MSATAIRLYVDEVPGPDREIDCTRAQVNYLVNVMRLKSGADILIFDGRSGEWRAELIVEARGKSRLRVAERVRQQQEGPDIEYLFAPLKRARLDYMVQKATELGVAVLQPVVTQHTAVQRVNVERMRANVIEAAEQCGVLNVPDVRVPLSFDKLLDGWDASRRIIYCDEDAPVASPLDVLSRLERAPLAVLIGPEGGFESRERDRLRSLEFVTPISLGPRVMRADTAAVAALSLVNAVLGDWQ
ncbi:MAG: 16S rRNA (uracil(1498)-N(3))-methyltransferase [Hyphomicrobiaceae bacterium]|nr:16S rRNA (uracil(1498)-N(3))-methyltransferase [Hyphomicrobiaceae bacterium]